MPTERERLWAENDLRLSHDPPETIRALRILAGLSQSGLAARLGVHPQTVSKWERGIMEIPPWVELALKTLAAESS